MRQKDVTIPLDIPDVKVLQTSSNERGEIIITIESIKSGTRCRKCGKWITKSHGLDEWVTIRHLPAFGRRTYVRYRPKRYQCQDCEGRPTTTEVLEWHESNSPNSFAYDNHLLLQLVNSTIEDVSVKEDVAYDKVVGALERRLAARVDWTLIAEVVALGVDEIALRKGRKDYITLVTGRLADGEIILLGVLAGHEKATVVDFLRSIPLRIAEKIQSVCCDLWEAYIQAVREELAHVRIVADRFHVAKHYYEAADQERKRELKHLKKTLPKEEYKTLEGSMYAFRKRHEDLDDKERKTLNRFLRLAPVAKQAYELRERLTAIFDAPLSKEQAQAKILRWMKKVQASGLQGFDTFMKLLAGRWEEITNYFIERENSGFVEGFNNKVKVLKRRCYGIFNLQHLFQRIYLDLTGYRLFAPATISG
jgi:transposase